MSYLTAPRLSFIGKSYANASTANNNDLADVYDIDTMTLNQTMTLIPGATAIQPPAPGGDKFNWNGPSDNPGLRNWLMGLMQTPPDVHEGGDGQMAHWNYYGDHNTEFREATINGATRASGQPANANDLALSLNVDLLGDIFYGKRRGAVLVDADPYALVTSQIFSGQFKLTYQPTRLAKIPVLMADHPTPAYSYFINPYKNLNPGCTGFEAVSAVFQFGLPRDNLAFFEGEEFVSPALNDLKAKALAGNGLMVRFCLYDAIFKVQAPQLNAAFNKGDYVFNPYLGRVLGTIGVWNDGELASAPPGRKLRVQVRFPYTPPPSFVSPDELAEKHKRMASVAKYKHRPKQAAPADSPKATLGVTLASVDTQNSIVSLDCISTFPEANPETRDKLDLGPMSLILRYGANNGQSVTIGAIPYDRATYESGGGMVDVSYAGSPDRATINASISTGQLVITRNPAQACGQDDPTNPSCLLLEVPAIDTQTDNRVVYFDAQVKQGDANPPGTSQIAIQVANKGTAPTMPTTLNLEYWMCQKDLVNPDKPQVPVVELYFNVAEVTSTTTTTYYLPYLSSPTNPQGKAVVITQQVTVPAGGQLTLNLTAKRPGVSMIRFVDPSIQPPPPPNFGWDNVDFAIVRILPFDDYSQYTDAQINNWNFMVANVFGFYSVMYPVMSKVIPWGPDNAPNNSEDVKQFASELLAFTDPSMWSTTIYMPITRDMSGGKRELLRRWCNLQQ